MKHVITITNENIEPDISCSCGEKFEYSTDALMHLRCYSEAWSRLSKNFEKEKGVVMDEV